MTEMDHHEFLASMEAAQEHGLLRFTQEGKHYLAAVDEMWLGNTGKCVIVTPQMRVRKNTDEWVELSDNGPRHVVFNWLSATFHWLTTPDLQNGKICIRTDEGPIYILLNGDEEAAVA